jgi:hypothetical protein
MSWHWQVNRKCDEKNRDIFEGEAGGDFRHIVL